jgi:glutamine amidotransferase
MARIAVVDYGMGNLRSVAKAVEHVSAGVEVIVTADPAVLSAADRVVFPGQGAMPDCMHELDARNLRAAVLDAARNKPFLGICIGLQMLFDWSDEGDVAGLGVFAGKVRRFPAGQLSADGSERLKVPHMGWNEVEQQAPHALWRDIGDTSRFYFVHSYYVEPEEAPVVAGVSRHGLPFTAAVARDNLFAVQFHPEKSADAGLRLLANFVSWNP